MRKLTSVLLIVFLFALASICTAESFRLYDGVRFGLTINEVQAIEKNAQNLTMDSSNNYIDFNKLRGSFFSETILSSSKKLNIGGYDGLLYYSFTSKDSLNGCYYTFNHGNDNAKILNTIYSSMTSKYGKPTTTKKDGFLKLSTQAKPFSHLWDSSFSTYTDSKTVGTYDRYKIKDKKITDGYQWLIKQNDKSAVLIELLKVSYTVHREYMIYYGIEKTSDSEYSFVLVSYNYISPDELNTYLSKQASDANRRQSDF